MDPKFNLDIIQGRSKLKENDFAKVDKMAPNSKVKHHKSNITRLKGN
jgi:hypothetical protein